MEIRILNGCGARPLNAAIMAEALIRGKKLKVNHPFCQFEVADWSEFCGIVFHCYAEFTRDSRGQLLRGLKLGVGVKYKDNFYSTQVWFDETEKCLRYVSLS